MFHRSWSNSDACYCRSLFCDGEYLIEFEEIIDSKVKYGAFNEKVFLLEYLLTKFYLIYIIKINIIAKIILVNLEVTNKITRLSINLLEDTIL